MGLPPERLSIIEAARRVIDSLPASDDIPQDVEFLESLSQFQRDVVISRWEMELRRHERDFFHMVRVSSAVEDDALRKALAAQQRVTFSPRSSLPGQIVTPIGCTSNVTSAPFPAGYPITEQSGEPPIVSGSPTKAFAELPGSESMRTFIQLAVPHEGTISLGLALGRAQVSGSFRLVYPASQEVPGSLYQVVEITNAQGGLGYLSSIPGAPSNRETYLRVGVKLAVESERKSYYLLLPPTAPGPPAGVTVGVDAHVVLLGSEGDTSDDSATFLRHHKLSGGGFDWQEVPPQTDLGIEANVTLRPGSKWVYVGVEVMAWAQRYWLFPPSEKLVERSGFISVDLRSPDHHLPPPIVVLEPSGPVKVQQIQLTFCPPPPLTAPA